MLGTQCGVNVNSSHFQCVDIHQASYCLLEVSWDGLCPELYLGPRLASFISQFSFQRIGLFFTTCWAGDLVEYTMKKTLPEAMPVLAARDSMN